jgi:hypothetical protein
LAVKGVTAELARQATTVTLAADPDHRTPAARDEMGLRRRCLEIKVFLAVMVATATVVPTVAMV